MFAQVIRFMSTITLQTAKLKRCIFLLLVLPPVLVPRHSEWPPMHPRLPPPYHSTRQESSMPVNASFPANFRQTPGDDIPSPFRQGENYNRYEMPGNIFVNDRESYRFITNVDH